MFKLKFKKLSKLLKNNTLIPESVSKQLYVMENIEDFLSNMLPNDLKQHCYPLNVRNKKLVLVIDSPAWKSRLHYLLPTIEPALRKKFPKIIMDIELKIIPPSLPPKPKLTPARKELTEQSRGIITSMADGMEDSDLKRSLERLGKHR